MHKAFPRKRGGYGGRPQDNPRQLLSVAPDWAYGWRTLAYLDWPRGQCRPRAGHGECCARVHDQAAKYRDLGCLRPSSFLYSGTRSMFEKAGFDYERPKGKNHCVMRKIVPAA
jgi:hypothetical protein